MSVIGLSFGPAGSAGIVGCGAQLRRRMLPLHPSPGREAGEGKDGAAGAGAGHGVG
ncbi:hypothetical protein [Arthrobacter sp. Leaf337]|uniref:hypothetical protein n=1 Tax=Arthrobacter sp. Leaf337 TaxID=1736342 RepID=UPI001F1611E6|nr:hypothetical protein [Arthrobacter sp. Leaf337]